MQIEIITRLFSHQLYKSVVKAECPFSPTALDNTWICSGRNLWPSGR